MPIIQLDLFEERTLRLLGARRALLESLDLETAREELRRFVARHGADPEAERLSAAVAGIEALPKSNGDESSGDGADPIPGLLRLGPAIPDWLRPGWHRRLALDAERLGGIGCGVGSETTGYHFLRAGDLDRAERSLRATLEREPADGRSRARLGDVLHKRGEPQAARLEYARSLVDAPGTVDWEGVADQDIAALPPIATSEYQVEGEPADWAAAVGTVEGVFPWPAPTLAGLDGPPSSETSETGQPGLRFHRLLCEERAARVLADRTRIRRAMKQLCPALLAAYLERWR